MADITTPQPGDEILANWGQSVADALNGMQMGTVQISMSNQSNNIVLITFPKPYAAPPTILVAMGPGNGYAWIAAYTDNLNGLTFKAIAFHRAATSSTATVTVSWLAIGDLA
jgi:hypothetical protein